MIKTKGTGRGYGVRETDNLHCKRNERVKIKRFYLQDVKFNNEEQKMSILIFPNTY